MGRCYVLALVMIVAFVTELTSYAWAGDIQGSVSIQSALRPRAVGKSKVRGYGSGDEGPGYGQSSSSAGDGTAPAISRELEIQYVVISLTPLSGKLKPAPGTYRMQQNYREFKPHVLPIVRGSKVQFLNSDPFLHHIYSVSDAASFDLPKHGQGMTREVSFNRAGVVEIFCGIHSRMNAYIVVLDNNFFAMPTSNHRYQLSGVPSGNYQLRAWHPRANSVVKPVQVPASGLVQMDISL